MIISFGWLVGPLVDAVRTVAPWGALVLGRLTLPLTVLERSDIRRENAIRNTTKVSNDNTTFDNPSVWSTNQLAERLDPTRADRPLSKLDPTNQFQQIIDSLTDQ